MAQCRMKRFDVTGNSALILQRALKHIADNVPLAPQETANAERRQLTVLFADMADSTALSQRIDPEELRGINRTYQDAAKTAIEAYGGYIARYMGDGCTGLFWLPSCSRRRRGSRD